MFLNNKKRLFLIFVSVFVISISSSIYFWKNNNENSAISAKEKTSENEHKDVKEVFITQDINTADKLSDMIDSSDLIVIESYENLDSTWNTARDPEDISKESKDDYIEGRIYNFKINEVLNGDVKQTNIKINHRYSQTEEIEETSGDEIISPEGILIKAPSKSVIHKVEIKDPTFIEPEFNGEYIAFLKPGYNDVYFRAIEPFLVKVDENNVSTLQHNLMNIESNSKTTEILGEQTFLITNDFHTSTSLTDEISGMTLNEIKEVIKKEIK